MKEIDFLKTGVRWNMNQRLRKNLKKLPYFLLYNYESKLNRYHKIISHNKKVDNPDDKIPLNCYFSPSPMNELCEYINTWERRNILWDNTYRDNRDIILDKSIDYNDKTIRNAVRKILNDFNRTWSETLKVLKATYSESSLSQDLALISPKTYAPPFIEQLDNLPYDSKVVHNYLINESYRYANINKSLCWIYSGDTILDNLKVNTPKKKGFKIIKTDYPTENSHNYLGKWYELIEYDSEVEFECIFDSMNYWEGGDDSWED